MLWKGKDEDSTDAKSLYSPRIGDPLAVNSGYFGEGYLDDLDSEASIVGAINGVGKHIEEIDVEPYSSEREKGISVDPKDGSIWYVLANNDAIIHVDRD